MDAFFLGLLLIFKTLEFFELAHRRDSNRQDKSNSFGWASILNGFRDKDSDPIEYESLLPFPESKEESKPQKRVLTAETAQVLAHLLDTGQIPGRVKHFIAHIEDVKQWQIKNR